MKIALIRHQRIGTVEVTVVNRPEAECDPVPARPSAAPNLHQGKRGHLDKVAGWLRPVTTRPSKLSERRRQLLGLRSMAMTNVGLDFLYRFARQGSDGN